MSPKRWHFTAAHLADYPPDDPARQFAEDVASKPERHNRWVHLACRRHALDLAASRKESFPFVYDCKKAYRPTRFAREFNGVEGPLAGKPLEFLPWQVFCTAMTYGWRLRADPRRRRFRYVYLEIPRKNGKTSYVSPHGGYQLAFPPPNARCDVFSVATKEDQAKIVWRDFCRLSKTNKAWADKYRKLTKTLTHVPSDSTWTPVGSDSDTLDGLRPELAIMDELHKWKNRQLWDVFNNAFGAAFSPLIFQITTSGDDTESICYEQHNRVEKILDSIEDNTYDPATGDEACYFGVIWTIDAGDKWDDPESWYKANPSLGVVKPVSEIEIGVEAARASEGARRAFMRDHLNVWQATGTERFLDMDKWRDCHVGDPLTSIEAWDRIKGLPAWGGLDPSSARDITAACFIAEDPNEEGAIIAVWDFWVPGENLSLRIAKEALPYDEWSRAGFVKTTEGACIDINVIKEQCVMRRDWVDLRGFGFDEGMSQGIGISLLNDHNFPAAKVGQGYWLSPALQEIERLTLAGKLHHFGNPVARAHANASVIFKGDSRIKLTKGKAKDKHRIDGIAALAMAIASRQESISAGKVSMGMSYV